jgi:hypothetical protein
MENWVASHYVYADGVAWRKARREIFVLKDGGERVSVGGAITLSGDGRSIAFLCPRSLQRHIDSEQDILDKVGGRYVYGNDLHAALRTLKWKYPNPIEILEEQRAMELANF